MAFGRATGRKKRFLLAHGKISPKGHWLPEKNLPEREGVWHFGLWAVRERERAPRVSTWTARLSHMYCRGTSSGHGGGLPLLWKREGRDEDNPHQRHGVTLEPVYQVVEERTKDILDVVDKEAAGK